MIQLYYSDFCEDQSAAWKALLHEILREQGIHFSQILEGANGKPYLKDGPYFNLSHSKQQLVLALSDAPVGVDLEQIREVSGLVPPRVLSSGEYRWFQSRGSLPEDFLQLWTLKESYYKYLGTGLMGYPNRTDFRKEPFWHLEGSSACFACFQDSKLVTSVCSGREQEIIRHFL